MRRHASFRSLYRSEATKNLLTHPWLSLAVVLVVSCALVTVFIAEYNNTAAILNYASDSKRLGANTLLIEPAPGGATSTLSLHDCVALGQIDGVEGALALKGPVNAHAFGGSGKLVPVWLVAGNTDWLTPATQPAPAGQVAVIVDDQANLPQPQYSLEVDGTATFTNSHPADLTTLGVGLAGNALIPVAPTFTPDLCIIRIDPDERLNITNTVANVFPTTSGYSQRWAFANAERFPVARSRYQQRPTQHLWLVTTAILLLFGAMYLRIRRSDFSVYRDNGLSPTKTTQLAASELSLLWFTSTTASISVLVSVAVTRHADGVPLMAAIVGTTRTALAALLAFGLVATTASPVSPVAALKDR